MPDRLPSLIVLVAFWIPPAVAGGLAADYLRRTGRSAHAPAKLAVGAAVVIGYAAAWFLFNVGRMPPYIPGATMDPTVATPRAVMGLAIFTAALILPGSALAFVLGLRLRERHARRFIG